MLIIGAILLIWNVYITYILNIIINNIETINEIIDILSK